MYNIAHTHFRDITGKLLWVEPISEENKLYNLGEKLSFGEIKYQIKRMAVVDNTQHVNVSVIAEDLNIVEPYL